MGKERACNAGDLASIPGSGRAPGGGRGNSLQYSCLESPHGQRSLAGCNSWGCRVRHDRATNQLHLDMAEPPVVDLSFQPSGSHIPNPHHKPHCQQRLSGEAEPLQADKGPLVMQDIVGHPRGLEVTSQEPRAKVKPVFGQG